MDEVHALLEQERYGAAMTALARLRAPLDAFFDRVTVNAPEPRFAPQSFASSQSAAGDYGPGRRFFPDRRLKEDSS